jgi:putative ABC transport system permease protein
MQLRSTLEGVTIALESLRANKVRAFLTILGVGIGVATVTGMASILAGVERGISEDIEAVGPENFQVARFDQTKIRFTGRQPWEGKPSLSMTEADALASLSAVRSVTPATSANAGDLKYGSRTFTGVQVIGIGPEWVSYMLGDFAQGRNFGQHEYERSAPVAVISTDLAEEVFHGKSAVGQRIRMGGMPFQVVGVYKPKPNLFQGGKQLFAHVPATSAFKFMNVNEDWMEFWIVPAAGVGQTRAMDEVTVAMRTMRRLRPADENNFALVRQEAVADLVGKITGAVTLVMMVLASIGLMVGGVGVVGIMLISVTERTREIGVRKALGARRGEILWQFLVEAATVTVVGALFGLVLGAGGALLLGALTPIPTVLPLWSILVALVAAAVTGILFGLYPAWRAANLDPVEALRYE